MKVELDGDGDNVVITMSCDDVLPWVDNFAVAFREATKKLQIDRDASELSGLQPGTPFAQLMCRAQSFQYDFKSRVATITVPEMACVDMTGATDMAKSIDRDVRRVVIRESTGATVDIYAREDAGACEWSHTEGRV